MTNCHEIPAIYIHSPSLVIIFPCYFEAGVQVSTDNLQVMPISVNNCKIGVTDSYRRAPEGSEAVLTVRTCGLVRLLTKVKRKLGHSLFL